MAVVGVALTAGAVADDSELRMVPNGHGQSKMLFAQTAERTASVALFTGNRGLGSHRATTAVQSEVRAVTRDNGHGQQTTLFQQDR